MFRQFLRMFLLRLWLLVLLLLALWMLRELEESSLTMMELVFHGRVDLRFKDKH
jgi:hypothetical protein